ncbi:hypothetical protein D3C79_909230 [compost metagenome]
MPMESLKKASPMAVSTTPAVTLEKSGENRKFSPSLAPGRVRLRMPITSSRMKSTGISRLVTASIPFDTPISNMPPISASTSHCQSRLCKGSVMSELKAAPVTAGSVERISPLAALKM